MTRSHGDSSSEIFDIVDEQGCIVGQASRKECHSNPRLLHQAVHLFVFDQRGRLFLQKRSLRKDIQPGKWDTSVGGHVAKGEAPEETLRREMQEELGILSAETEFLHHYIWRSPVETEFVRTYRCVQEGPFLLQPEEIDEGRFFSTKELLPLRDSGLLTPNLIWELGLLGIL